MLYVKLQIFLILNIDIIKELRSTCSASNLSALEALNFLWIHRGFDLVVMNCVSSLHISGVHTTTCLWCTSYIGCKLDRSSVISSAFSRLSIILQNSTVNGQRVSKLIFLGKLFLTLVLLRSRNTL